MDIGHGHWLYKYLDKPSGGGGGDVGYECTETSTVLTEESVITIDDDGYFSGNFSYSTPINYESIKVTFNGTEYDCPRTTLPLGGGNEYGAPDGDFSQYPFSIVSSEGAGNTLFTETTGTYEVKVESVVRLITTTPCFRSAVESISGTTEPLIANDVGGVLDKSYTEITEALDNSRAVYIHDANLNTIGSVIARYTNDRNFKGTIATVDASTSAIVTYTEDTEGHLVKNGGAVEA